MFIANFVLIACFTCIFLQAMAYIQKYNNVRDESKEKAKHDEEVNDNKADPKTIDI